MSGTNRDTIDLTLTDVDSGCTCCTPGHVAKESQAVPAGLVSEDLLVSGMTCTHCVSSVTEELSSLEGVQAVDVALNAGGISRVTVSSSRKLRIDDVRAAVAEAGYKLVVTA